MKKRKWIQEIWRDSGLSKRQMAAHLSFVACNLWWLLLTDRAAGAGEPILTLLLYFVVAMNVHGGFALVRQKRRRRRIRAAFEVERNLFQHALAEGDLPLAKQHLDILERLPQAYSPEEAYGPEAGAVSGVRTPGPEGEKPAGGGSAP